jgi:hypothetical protein
VTFSWPDGELPSVAGLAREPLLDRGERIHSRELAVEEALEPLASELREAGATAVSAVWLTNSLQVSMTASRVIEFLDRHPEATASLNGELAPEWSGGKGRTQTGASRLVNAGFDGDPAGFGRYRIGIIEAQNAGDNWPSLDSHPVFRESGTNPSSRIQLVEDCNSCTGEFLGICVSWGCESTSNRSSVGSHGDTVAWVAAGSIEQGQDSGVVSSSARLARSGMAPETLLDYYGVNDCDAVTRALQRSVERGVDVVNMSFRGDFVNSETSSCDTGLNCGGMNEAIRAATDAGVLVVKSAGNFGQSDPDCSLTYPAWRPEVVAVGGLQTNGAFGTLSSVPRLATSSRGGVSIHYAGIGDLNASGLALMAPANWECYPEPGGASPYNCVVSRSGTSFAAPVVSGTASLFAHSLSTSGAIANARHLLVNMLLMGDGGASTSGISDVDGFGRMRAFAPKSSILTAPWGWGTHSIGGGVRTVTYTVWDAGPESPNVSEWRWAAASFEDDLQNLETDYVLYAYDACPPGGGRQLVKADVSFDPRKRIQLDHDEICPPGQPTCRCLEMDVQILSAPTGGVNIHMADYFHGGDSNAF